METLDEFVSRLDGAEAAFAHTDAADHRAAELIARDARPPRRTGRLGAGIHTDGAFILVDAPYGLAVHNGVPRRGQRAQPFLTDAAQRQADAVMDVYEQHVIDAWEDLT